MQTYGEISQTAKFVAYLRTCTDIPHSREIAEACGASLALHELFGATGAADVTWLAPVIEQRYKSVDAALCQQNVQHVVELAAGVSPRGLIWSAENKGVFLETDLAGILEEKKNIVRNILGRGRLNLRFQALNAVTDDATELIGAHIKDGRVAVLNEGLLPYLTHEEKRAVAQNVHRLLTRFGGVWITPDVASSKERFKKLAEMEPQIRKMLQTISGATNRDMEANFFGSEEEAVRFFEDIGFNVEIKKQSDLVPRSSLSKRVQIDSAKMLEMMLGHSTVCVMSPR